MSILDRRSTLVLRDQPPLKAGINYIDKVVALYQEVIFPFVIFSRSNVNKEGHRQALEIINPTPCISENQIRTEGISYLFMEVTNNVCGSYLAWINGHIINLNWTNVIFGTAGHHHILVWFLFVLFTCINRICFLVNSLTAHINRKEEERGENKMERKCV